MKVPRYLYHQTSRKHLESVLLEGLVPKEPGEGDILLAKKFQNISIVWLTEEPKPKFHFYSDPRMLRIDTNYLDKSKLRSLKVRNVKWWGYEGGIPPKALREEG